MSKQLTLSAAFSVLATVAFVLSATPNALADQRPAAPASLAAPALETVFSGL